MRLRELFLGAVLCGAPWIPFATAGESASATMLPEAPEKVWIGLAGGTESGWATRIRRMVRRGAVIPPERIAPLARYLAASLPPRVTAAAIASSPISTTVSRVELRPLQVWVRTAGLSGPEPRTVTAQVRGEQAAFIRPGQRVRVFQLRSRASMYQGQVAAVELRDGLATVRVALRSHGMEDENYLLEIIADLGSRLSIPNEAVIEEGERQIVYVRQASGDYVPREMRTGQRGESYVEVAEGLKVGEEVVTFGSFFIDAEFRMKGLAGS
jgi:hypothetical protein